MIGIGLIVMLLIPGVLLLLNLFLKSGIVGILAIVLFVIGVLILSVFACLLTIELKQDSKVEKYYSKHRNVKIPLNDKACECGACGNRKVSLNSIYCNICGCKFENIKDRTPQEIIDRKARKV